MHLIIAFLAVISCVALPLNPRQFPECAILCIYNADTGDCSPTDNACLCRNEPFVDGITSCLAQTCSDPDREAGEALAQQLCAEVGVTLAPPTPTSSTLISDVEPSTTLATPSNTIPPDATTTLEIGDVSTPAV